MSECRKCGCTKPCSCDYYTPKEQDRCFRCGCTKPCSCDQYSERDNYDRLQNYRRRLANSKILTEEVLGEKLCFADNILSNCIEGQNRNFDCITLDKGGDWENCHFKHYRSFDTDQDRLDLFRKLVELGKWQKFRTFTYITFGRELNAMEWLKTDYAAWLFIDNPERACCLVAEFWRENKK